MPITELERIAMDGLLAGDDPVLASLRRQFAEATVVQRKFTGVGFFTDFTLDASAPRVTPSNFELDGLFLELAGVKHGAGVVLFIRDGLINMLEGFTYIGPWPENTELLFASYPGASSGEHKLLHPIRERDLKWLYSNALP
jgi:hypothetical protein